MFITDNLNINQSGHLAVAGQDTVLLAKQYGTPLYLMDEELIRKTMQTYKNAIDKYYDGKGLVCYASKAFSCKQIYRIAKEEGIGIDVVSTGELYTARSVDFTPSMICCHGCNKSNEELSYAVEQGVLYIVVDSFNELDRLDEIAKKANKIVDILLRIAPGIEAHTHEFIRTGGNDTQFGFAIETGAAMEAVSAALTKKNLNVVGIHCHIGSQIIDIDAFEHTAEVMLSFMAKINEETGLLLTTVNLGGGFGIRYTQNDPVINYDSYMQSVSVALKAACEKYALPMPFVIVEPGRSIVGAAGVTLYEVGGVKKIPNIRTFVAIDGGMTDNIRFALYGAEYEFTIANKANLPKTQAVAISGPCCESGDMLTKETTLQECERGDILATFATGAYNYSMSSNYNRRTKPPVVMLYKGNSYIAVKRETLEDIIRNDN